MNNYYFYGQKVSQHGVEHKKVDFAALAGAVAHVHCDNPFDKFPDMKRINGDMDSEKIEELEVRIDELVDIADKIEEARGELDTENDMEYEAGRRLEEALDYVQRRIQEVQQEIETLKEDPEIMQWYVIDSWGKGILVEHTNEIVYECEELGVWFWGVTHWGTSWNYVLTEIPLAD